MADGVAITAGSGTTILTDDTGAPGHAQVVKLGISTDGSSVLLPSDATNGMLVNLGANNDVTVTGTVSVSASTVPVTDNGGSLTVDDGGSSLTVDGTVAISGTVAVTDNASTLSIDDGGGTITVDGTISVSASTIPITDNGGSLTVDGTVSVSSGTVRLGSTTASGDGVGVYRSLDLDETEEEVKGASGTLYGFIVTNRSTSSKYVKFYNGVAAGITVGSSTPNITVGVPGVSGEIVSMVHALPVPFGFSTGLCVAATGGFSDSDTTAPANNDVIINVFYS